MFKKKINYKTIFILCCVIVIFILFISLTMDFISINSNIKSIIVGGEKSIKKVWTDFTTFSLLVKIFLLILCIGFLLNFQNYFEINRLRNKLSLWSKLSYYVNQVGEEVFNKLPIGIVLIDDVEKGIQWLNPYANSILKNPVINTPLKNLNEEMEKLTNFADNNNTTIINIDQEKFECLYKKEFNVFYLFNVTEKEQIKKLYYQKTPALSILSFDNLEESLVRYDLSEQTHIQGQYLTVISEFAENHEGYLKKLFDNRFLLIIHREKLEIIIKDKFSILEQVRNISNKYQLKITLSIGIACWNLSYDKLSSYAQNAIELSQKRGGDQAVVNIENENIKFFGAKTDSFIKNSKVNVRVNAQILLDILNKNNDCFIMGHNNTDFDSLASMIAFYRIASSINNFNKQYLIIDEDNLDPSVTFVYRKLIIKIPEIKNNIIITDKAKKMIQKNDTLVILDTQSKEITNSPQLLSLTNNIVVIDHHRTPNDNIKSLFSYLNSSASSTVELMVELIPFLGKEIIFTPFEASIMYAGILLDTNNFTYRTSSITFEVLAKLKDLGADSMEVKSWLRNDFIKILEINKLIDKMEIYMGRFAIVKSEQIYDNRSFLAQVSETVLDIQNIDAAFTFTKLNENTVGISARSYNNVNVQILMEQLGGGGHLNSAATQIKSDNVEETVKKLKKLLKLEYETGVNMKIIVLEDIQNKGLKKGDIIKVKPIYGNFLIKSKKYLLANDENIEKIKKEKNDEIEKKRNHEFLMSKLKSEIDNKKINIEVKLGPNGKIYGKVTSKQIVEEFHKIYNIFIDKKKICLDGEINSLGIYKIEVILTNEIKAYFLVNVVDDKII
ncbi:50S ribosomal protein L9 [Candidatus Phytoplasma prunorum]|uniref:50S ribosomal protein L9 n=1 Tax=Candidatus Phytoplasma prunorum TaxID=47565 RepID=UPI002FF36A74